MKILITRPEKDSIQLVEQVKYIGYDPVLCPFFEINYNQVIGDQTLDGFDGLIITSKNALHAIRGVDKNIKLFVVGISVYELVLFLGFNNVIYAGINVTELKQKLENNLDKLLYLSAKDVTDSLDQVKNVTRIVVYEASAIDPISDIFFEFMNYKENRACIFFSVRAAKRFLYLINKYELKSIKCDIIIFTLSEAVASVFKNTDFTKCYVPNKPELTSLMTLVGEKLNE